MAEVKTPTSPQDRGRMGAAKRWGPDGRVVRLDSLDPVTREIVVSILRARKNAAAASGTE